jgi:hypothetical protein
LVVVLNEAYAQFNRDKMVVDKKGGDKKKGGKKAGSSTGDLMADGDIIAGAAAAVDSETVTADSAQLNPMFMSGDGGASGVGRSADSIVESSVAPDTASWQVVRTEFQTMQAEIAELKRQAEMRGTTSVSGFASRAVKQRFTHSPMRAAGAASAGPDARLALAADAPGANPLFRKAKGARRTGSRRGLISSGDAVAPSTMENPLVKSHDSDET